MAAPVERSPGPRIAPLDKIVRYHYGTQESRHGGRNCGALKEVRKVSSEQVRNVPSGAEHEGAAPYEAPALVSYGTVEEWTKGRSQLIQISIVI
jgi:hypothetical protein